MGPMHVMVGDMRSSRLQLDSRVVLSDQVDPDYGSTRQETALSVHLKSYCVEIHYFHFNVMSPVMYMLHMI